MRERDYWNPYLAGLLLGLLLLAVFLLMGRGLGAAGAYSAVAASSMAALAPDHAHANSVHSAYLPPGSSLLRTWIVLEVLGIMLGALLSALLAGRLRLAVLRGPRLGVGARLALAFSGGLLMGFAAKLARGCTSGLVLSGGALLSVGAWVFMLAVFAGGYAAILCLRRAWT